MSFSKCCVCTDEETPDNQCYFCSICAVSVHMYCYGFEKKKNTWTSDWQCSPCMFGVKSPICELCCQKGGAMKKTVGGKWAHVICALFLEGVKFRDKTKMEPVITSGIPKKNRGKRCAICNKTEGVSCNCSEKICRNFIHITCSQKPTKEMRTHS